MTVIMRCVLVVLGCFTAAAAELPPEILADRYLVKAEGFIARKRLCRLLSKRLNKIVALQSKAQSSRCRTSVPLQVCAGGFVGRLIQAWRLTP